MQLSPQHLAEVVESIRKLEDASSTSDKRHFARFNVVSKVEILNPGTGRTYTALTRDVSLEGIGLMQSGALTRGEQLAISLPRGKQGPLVAQVTVMHARELADGVWGIGALFVSANAQNSKPASTGETTEAQRISAKMLG